MKPDPAAEPVNAQRLRALLTFKDEHVFRASAGWASVQALSPGGTAWGPMEPLSTWLDRHVVPRDHDRVFEAVADAFRQRRVLDLTLGTPLQVSSNGRAHLHAIPSLSEHGQVEEWWAVLRNDMPHHLARERLEAAERQRRMRNTLALVRSIVRQSASGSIGAQSYAMHLEGRIDALIRVQAALARYSEAGLDLETLLRDELLTAGASDDVVHIVGTPVLLPAPVAEGLGLAFHELTTNSIKFGALSGAGRIDVSWVMEGNGEARHLRLSWREQASPAAGEAGKRRRRPPRRRGFGTELLERTLAYSLHATTLLEHLPDGVAYQVSLPLRRSPRSS